MIPEQLGPYRFDSELGRGGMGVVYRATHTQTGQTVAVKVLPAELARDLGFADRFAREIATLQKLDHPNIVKFIEPGEDSGYQYYVMEFVAGMPLDKIIIQERRIPWVRTVALGIQICRGLKHAHDHGIIHRDLKPANLLVTDDDTVKLTDFGIAKVFAGTAITATGGIIGTAEYMSPEQGDSKPITRRSDLYSLGVVLYVMLTGRPPFVGRGIAELINLHRYGQFDRPIAMVPEIPSWLDELVCQLLEKDPDKRPADAHVVARRLETVAKKVALRSAHTVVEGELTAEADPGVRRSRRSIGPATLMQRLMRAHLREMNEPNWIGKIFQKTWVLATALLLAVAALALFTLSSGEHRRWEAIHNLATSGDERDSGLLVELLRDYLRRYDTGSHAGDARRMLPEVERDRQRREFARSPIVGQLRPRTEPQSELERLYRKALLQLWLEGESATRSTLDEIIAHKDSAGKELFLVELAEEDILSLDLQKAESLWASGHLDEARAIWQRIIDEFAGMPRRARWVRLARQALAEHRTETVDTPNLNPLEPSVEPPQR